MKMFRKGQKGFTLVEIAIVLVIVGLVLFGVLKGADMVKSGKLKKTSKQLEQLSAATYAYVDKKKGAMPGEVSGTPLDDLVTEGIIGSATMTNGYGGAVTAIYNSASLKITSAGIPCNAGEAADELVEAVGVIKGTAASGVCAVTLKIAK